LPEWRKFLPEVEAANRKQTVFNQSSNGEPPLRLLQLIKRCQEVFTVEHANAEILLIALIMGVLLASLSGMIAVFSLARRWRRYQPRPQPIELPRPTLSASMIPVSVPALETAVIPKRITIPEHYRMPVQPGTPDQVTLSIQPSDGPTRDQRNVQKLIEFLKREIATVEQRAS
jgi:hypothetical protein